MCTVCLVSMRNSPLVVLSAAKASFHKRARKNRYELSPWTNRSIPTATNVRTADFCYPARSKEPVATRLTHISTARRVTRIGCVCKLPPNSHPTNHPSTNQCLIQIY
ncbi:hypothetical protein Y032_0224g2709 [Ancylostoma ceylanicum]|nr:hypothetical protein Y032_0224g2709 [Ancylostoma ceylanicum]